MAILVSFVLFVMVIALPKYSSQDYCVGMQSVYLAESFLFPATGPPVWYIPLKEKLTESKVISLLTGKDRYMEGGGVKTVCFTVALETRAISGTFELECTFDVPNEQSCSINPKDDVYFLVRPFVPKRSNLVTLRTDQSTYAAMLACIGGHTNLWFVLSTNATLSPEIEFELRDYFKGIDMGVNYEDDVEYSLSNSEIVQGGC